MVKHGNKSCFWIFKLQLHSAGYSDTDYPVISYLLELERMSRSKRSEHSTKVLRVGRTERTLGPHLDVENLRMSDLSVIRKWDLVSWGWGGGLTWCIGVRAPGHSFLWDLTVFLNSTFWRGTLRPPGAHQNLPPSTPEQHNQRHNDDNNLIRKIILTFFWLCAAD